MLHKVGLNCHAFRASRTRARLAYRLNDGSRPICYPLEMCGRFSRVAELSEIKIQLKVEQLELLRELAPLYNIAPSYGPGHEQPFVFQSRDGERVLRAGRWWMIPSFWTKPLKQLPAAFNARAEDVASRPLWRRSFEKHRCLVPATGWREFVANGKKKQPYQFKPRDSALFTFAGVWSRWTSPEGEVVDSFAITQPSPARRQRDTTIACRSSCPPSCERPGSIAEAMGPRC